MNTKYVIKPDAKSSAPYKLQKPQLAAVPGDGGAIRSALQRKHNGHSGGHIEQILREDRCRALEELGSAERIQGSHREDVVGAECEQHPECALALARGEAVSTR